MPYYPKPKKKKSKLWVKNVRLKDDGLHYNSRTIDSYNKTFNFVISEREPGKSKVLWLKAWKAFKHEHRPSIYLVRNAADMTADAIYEVENLLNLWLKYKIELTFAKGDCGSGICDVYYKDQVFVRFLSMNVNKRRFKSRRLERIKYFLMDEFIIDNRHGEKYLTDEAGKFKEIWNTYKRCATDYGLSIPKCYFMGNPYSVYNPYFIWLNVPLADIHPGAFLVSDKEDYAIECYQLKPELRAKLLKENPAYKFDDAYRRYAFDGCAINDQTFDVVPKKPDGYKLRFIFRIQNKYVNYYYLPLDRHPGIQDWGKYWVEVSEDYKGSKTVYAVDFNNLIAGTELKTFETTSCMIRLKECIGKRDITYQSIEAGYLTEAIYKIL